MTAPTYRTLSLSFDGGENGTETQIYVVNDVATEERIRSGDDEGVICLCIDPGKADLLANLLNNYASAGGHA